MTAIESGVFQMPTVETLEGTKPEVNTQRRSAIEDDSSSRTEANVVHMRIQMRACILFQNGIGALSLGLV